ncbi:MAG: GDP-mannose 4,6-dehydratase [Dehalococcoidia bacterium]
MKTLITGGCGFVGINLTRFLDRSGFSIRILDNFSEGKRERIESLALQREVEIIEGDLRDKEAVRAAVQRMKAVVHLAAHTSVVESVENPEEDWEINVTGTFNLLEACRREGVERFILASSNAVAGEQTPPIDETKIPQPLSPYGASKLAGEALCSAYYHSFGLKTFCLRFANVYGPFSDHKSSVIPLFLQWVREGKPLTVYGDGEQTRDFVHVDDICQAIYLALVPAYGHAGEDSRTSGSCSPLSTDDWCGEVFQIASGTETSINQLAGLLREVTGRDLEVVYHPERPGEIMRNYSDITKARKLLGFEPAMELKEGLRRMWEDG